jgi:hypothetical protein
LLKVALKHQKPKNQRLSLATHFWLRQSVVDSRIFHLS